MSRYSYLTSNEKGDFKVDFGWDRPLSTFFAIVYNERIPKGTDEYHSPVLWIGTEFGEIKSVPKLLDKLGDYIDPQMADFEEQLASDRLFNRGN